jgi:hypothetical protein
LTGVHRAIQAKFKTSFYDMDRAARVRPFCAEADEESTAEVDGESSDGDDESEDAFRWVDDYEMDYDCCYVDVETGLKSFAEMNFDRAQGCDSDGKVLGLSKGDTYVSLKEVQELLPPHGPCVGQRLKLVATCDAARALLPYVDQEALKSELIGKPWAAASHRFPEEAEVVEYQVKFNTLMKKLNSLWSLQSRSRLKRSVVKTNLGRLFLVPKSTRWDSLYDVMRFLRERYGRSAEQRLKLNEILAALGICSKSGKSILFTGDDMKFLEEYIQVRQKKSLDSN